ncbi:MAG: cpaB [Caulobacteraceae bacterium]|nr:cpaB [Caulobacteraceae bacterium]
MRVVTMASLGASAALGVAALFVARTWLPSNSQSKAEAATAASVKEWKTVVIAARPLAYGAKVESRDLVLAQLPSQYVPEGAFTTVASVLAQDHGAPPVVISAIAAREPILPAKVSGPGARPSVAIQIAEGKRAYAVRVNDVAGVGGNILPGDRVDVVLMRNLAINGGPPNLVAEVVIQNIRLLGIDLNVDPASTQTKVSNTATVEVTVEQAQKLSLATQLGTLSLALRRTGAADEAPIKAMRTTDMKLVGGYTDAARAPAVAAAAPAGPAQPKAPPVKRPNLIVVNGDKREPVEVPIEFSRGGLL